MSLMKENEFQILEIHFFYLRKLFLIHVSEIHFLVLEIQNTF